MRNILIVDGEINLLDNLKKIIEKQGHKVCATNSGFEALEIIKKNKEIDTLLTSISIPKINGLVLINEVKSTLQKKIDIIVMSGETDKRKVSHVLDLGISAFLQKPFSSEELLEVINNVEHKNSESLSDAMKTVDDGEFLKIVVNEFSRDPVAKFDIYIRFSNTKYLKVLNKDDELSIARLRKYKEKGLEYFYVKKSDHKKQLRDSINWIKNNKDLEKDSKKKTAEVRKLNELMMEEVYSENIDKEILNSSVQVAQENVKLVFENDRFMNLIRELQNYSNDLYRHLAGVNVFAIMLSRKIGWVSEGNLLKLTIASMYHDVGKKWIKKELLNKPLAELNRMEQEEYEQHPRQGVGMLFDIPNIPQDVLTIILHHHECCDGSGYPSGIDQERIHPLAKLVSITNEYCNLTLKQGNRRTHKHADAIQIMRENIDKYDKDMFEAFAELFSNDK